MIDQKQMWNNKHQAGEHADFRALPAPFAVAVEAQFPRQAEVLELGCGVGGDASFFASQGHHVIATDFSETVLDQDRQLNDKNNLEFSLVDITAPLPYDDQSQDVVYAHLSLHYYDNETTVRVFAEIARVLKIGGLLCFACKTVNDPEYGDGQEIEPNYFVSSKGHIRHFFTQEYAEKLVSLAFEVRSVDELTEHYKDKSASFLQCVAVKK